MQWARTAPSLALPLALLSLNACHTAGASAESSAASRAGEHAAF